MSFLDWIWPSLKAFFFSLVPAFEGELPRLDDECIKNVIDSRKSQFEALPAFTSLAPPRHPASVACITLSQGALTIILKVKHLGPV